jgi:hypothetical protein
LEALQEREKPDTVCSIEQTVKDKKRKQAERKAQKQEERDRQQERGGLQDVTLEPIPF